jgi:putative serine protease PepD
MGQVMGNPTGAAATGATGYVADADRRAPARLRPPEARREGSRGRRAGRYLLTLAIALALVVAGGGAGAVIALHYAKSATTVIVSSPPAAVRAPAWPGPGLARAAAAVMPSVVTITVTTATGTGEGSGVILRSDGTIVTNSHVIEAAAGGAGVIKVTFASGQSKNAVILGQDPAADIAVIRAFGVSGVVPARLAAASGLHVGDTVLAIGSPLGLAGTVTSGIVSALHRSIAAASQQPPDGPPGQSQGNAPPLRDVIQTDTAINPGNSGGALADDAGRVVGITTAIATVGGGYIGQRSGSIGVGFAIPSGAAYRIATRLLTA